MFLEVGDEGLDTIKIPIPQGLDDLVGARKFVLAIQRKVGEPPAGAKLFVSPANGEKCEVYAEYEEGNEEAVEYALQCAFNAPSTAEDV